MNAKTARSSLYPAKARDDVLFVFWTLVLLATAATSATMCEFCLDPKAASSNRDAFHSDFTGFFSADAIDAAVRQANARRNSNEKNDDEVDDDDDDGT